MKSITIKSVPDEVHEAMKELADVHHRSLNGEIIHCMELYAHRKRMSTEDILKRVEKHQKNIKHWFTPEEIQAAKVHGRK